MIFDPAKPCQTRSGKPVTIVATDWPGEQPILGRIGNDCYPEIWCADGTFQIGRKSSLDLVNVTGTYTVILAPKKTPEK